MRSRQTVIDLQILPRIGAVLTLKNGKTITVGPEAQAILRDQLLTIGATSYRLPLALVGQLTWALALRPSSTLTLTAVEVAPDTITFTADGAAPYTLTAPRAVWTRPGRPIPRLAGMPINLMVSECSLTWDRSQIDAPCMPARIFAFSIYPETPEGAACLAALGWAEWVGLPDGEE